MVRRRATAVLGNYSPLDKKDKCMPRAGTKVNPAAKGSAPTGRLVITSTSGGPAGGDQVTHWCPDPRQDVRDWTCPEPGCGMTFTYSPDDREWTLV